MTKDSQTEDYAWQLMQPEDNHIKLKGQLYLIKKLQKEFILASLE